jgi:four helix bundle protein
LTSQLRRASSSIAANIAEGCGRRGDAELARFCTIASGSAHEVDYHLLLAKDLRFIQAEAHEHLAAQTDEVKRILGL